MQPQSWRRAWKTKPWMQLLSGATCDPSRATSSVAAWTSQSAAFPARTSPLPESERDSAANEAASSSTSSAWLAKWDPDTSSWRTSQGSLLEARSIPFSGPLPRAGSMRSGRLYERPRLALPTEGSGGSAWPTAQVRDEKGPGPKHTKGGRDLSTDAREWQIPSDPSFKYRRQVGRTERAEELLPLQAENWPTPAAMDGEKCSNPRRPGDRTLPDEAKGWQTPTTTDSVGRDYTYPSGDKTNPFPTLVGQAKDWQTPSVADTEGSRERRGGKRSGELLLNGQAKDMWITPRTVNARGSKRMREQGSNESVESQAQDFPYSPPAPATETPGERSSPSPRRLNPLFVCWLMGWPRRWAFASMRLEPAETASYLSRLRSRFTSLLTDLGLEG